MHLNVEGLRPWDWSYPVLQYLREWPTPTVIIIDMALSLSPNIHPSIHNYEEKWSWSPSESGLPGITDTPGNDRRFSTYWLSGFELISDGMVGLYISFGRLSQCTWSVEGLRPWNWVTHTRYCSISGRDPLRHSSSSSSRVLSLNTNHHQTIIITKSVGYFII